MLSDDLVQDDVVEFGAGDQIAADAVVLDGSAQANESLITGEARAIPKECGAELKSGSFLMAGRCVARLTRVGAESYASRLTAEAQADGHRVARGEMMRNLDRLIKFIGVALIPIGAVLIWKQHWVLELSMKETVDATVAALIGMIPEGLYLLTSVALAVSMMRLARRKVLAQQLYCIETLARVDVLCLDKTGTITSGRMEVEGTYPLPVEGMGAGESDAAVPVDTTVLDFALANVARATSADANETCQALLNYYADRPVEVSEPLSVIPFSSSKKWSGASFAQGSYVMGAAQFVLSERAFSQVENRVAELADTCRVLVVARVDGFTPDGDMVGEAEPVGFVTIRDEIRTSAAETIGYFNEQGVTLNVISGDDPRTVSSIARVVGVPGADAYVDATTLDTPAKLDAAVDRYHVFGRVTPQQKRELVQALKRRAHTVAMTGDGVNDVLALKEADCSVAMAAGSDAARNVAEIVLVDNDFASMPAVVAEGRRSINNLQRSASLFLTKTLFSMGLAALCIALPPYPFEPIQMTLINFFCIGAPGFVLGLEPNNARVKGSFLTNVLKRALPASLAVILAAALDIFVARVFGFNQLTPSTMCLLTSCAASVSLIWRISQPLTPLPCGALCVCSCRHPDGRYRIPEAAVYCQPVDGPDGYLGCHRGHHLLGVL